jgi:hypothetical protein
MLNCCETWLSDGMLNVLISWPYLATMVKSEDAMQAIDDMGDDLRILVDSGAFTNWKAGIETKVVDYIAFLKGLPFTPWRYFTLDKIGDPETTQTNLDAMCDAGLTPVPIFTRGTRIEELDRLYQYSDLVGLGVGVGSSGALNYVRWMAEQNQRPMHWLGVANPGLVGYHQPYSCDASSWESGGRYGTIPMYYGRGKMNMLRRTTTITGGIPPVTWRAIQSYGVDPRVLQFKKNWFGGRTVARMLGAQCWIRYAEDAERINGTMIFLAFTNWNALGLLLDAYRSKDAAHPLSFSR